MNNSCDWSPKKFNSHDHSHCEHPYKVTAMRPINPTHDVLRQHQAMGMWLCILTLITIDSCPSKITDTGVEVDTVETTTVYARVAQTLIDIWKIKKEI